MTDSNKTSGNKIIEEEETRILSNYISESTQKLGNISGIFSSVFNNLNSFQESISKNIPLLYDLDKTQTDNQNNIDVNINNFYKVMLSFTDKLTNILELINSKIIIPFKKYKSDYEKKTNLINDELSALIAKFNEEKNKNIYYKNKYITNKKNLSEDDNIKNPTKILKDKEIFLLKTQKTSVKIDKQNYLYQLDNFNNFFNNEFKSSYKKQFEEIENNERDKILFLQNIFDLFSSHITTFEKALNSFSSDIKNKVLEKIDTNKKIENILSNNQLLERRENVFLNENKDFELISQNSNNFNITNEVKFPNIVYNGTTFERIINEYFEYLNTRNELPIELKCEINDLFLNIDRKNEFYTFFLGEYLKRHQDEYFTIQMLNEKNCVHLSHIFSILICTTLLSPSPNYKLLLLILLLGQKICFYKDYKNSNYNDLINKIEQNYLCNIMSRQPLFSCKEMWSNLFKHTLIFNISLNDNSEISNSIYEIFNSISFDDLRMPNDSVFNCQENKYKDAEQLITNTNKFISKIIDLKENFKKQEPLLKTNKKVFNEVFVKFHKVVLFLITCFVNYNFEMADSIEFLVDLISSFFVSNDVLNYYIIYLKNYYYSIKQFSKGTNYKIKIKIDEIRVDSKINNIDKNMIKNEKKELELDEKIIIISKTIKYLNIKEKLSLLFLNKILKAKLSKKIYKNILNDIDIKYIKINSPSESELVNLKEAHLNVWKILLKYNEIKTSYPYEENKKKALQIKYKHSNTSDLYIIDLDCTRTYFGEDVEIKQKRQESLNNILKTVIMLNEGSKYCQGMNFTVGFILQMCDGNEEECFYLSMGLFTYTKYKSIFLKDLKILRLYFNIFEKILYLYIPTLYTYFCKNKIYPNFYLSPWFLTIFANNFFEGQGLLPFIKTYDLYIIYGWKIVFNIALNIIKKRQEIIMESNNESMIKIITEKLGELFTDDNNNFYRKYLIEDEFDTNVDKIKISKKLIENIENEYMQSEKLIEGEKNK